MLLTKNESIIKDWVSEVACCFQLIKTISVVCSFLKYELEIGLEIFHAGYVLWTGYLVWKAFQMQQTSWKYFWAGI